MFVAVIYKQAGLAEIDRIVGGFESNEEAAEWCSHNVAQPFDIREVEHYEALDNLEDVALDDYFTAGYRLSPANKYYGVELEGIAFGMLDRNGTIVKCLVTYQAITDRMGGVHSPDQQITWFLDHRREVEAIASEKFVAGSFSDGEFPTRIETRDLNPDQFDL